MAEAVVADLWIEVLVTSGVLTDDREFAPDADLGTETDVLLVMIEPAFSCQLDAPSDPVATR